MLKEADIANTEAALTLEDRRAFMRLSIAERRQTMAGQAMDLMRHYDDEVEAHQRESWQGGDIVEL